MTKPNWLLKLKVRWNLKSFKQVWLVLLVFSLTGTTVLILKKPLFRVLPEAVISNTWFHIAYYILILPIYNVILLIYGAIFGQFNFFWEFEKRMFSRFKNR